MFNMRRVSEKRYPIGRSGISIMWIVAIVCICASLIVATSISDLIVARQAIQHQLAALQKQVSDVRLAKYTLSGLKEATNIISSNMIGINGYSSADVSSIGSEVSDQFQELERHERSLQLRMEIVQRSLEVLAVNITQSGSNPLLKRIASNMYGTAFISPNGTLYYVGAVNSYLQHGRSGYTTDFISTFPMTVDTSPLEGTVVTQVYAGRFYFIVVTAKGEIWHWGGNDGTIGAVAGTGMSNSGAHSFIMRKLDFGLIGKQVIPKEIICDQSPDPYPVLNCHMLSMEGELYFWGVWSRDYTSWSTWSIVNGPNSNKVRKLKIQFNGEEKFASDLAISQVYLPSPPMGVPWRSYQTICVIERDNATNIYCTGDNNGGQFGDGSTSSPANVPNTLEIASNNWVLAKPQTSAIGEVFTQIYGAKQTIIAVGASGKAYSWGSVSALLGRGSTESNTKIGRTDFSNYFTTSRICSSPGSDIIFLVSSSNNQVYLMGVYNGENFNSPYQPPAFKGKSFVDCEVNELNAIIVFSNGQTYAKGRNDAAQLMVGFTSPANTPVVPFTEAFFPVYYK